MNRQSGTPYSHTIRSIITILALALPVLWPASVMGQKGRETLPKTLTDTVLALAYTHSLDKNQVEHLLAPLDRAFRQDLPVEPLVKKIEEGLAKHVPTDRIVPVLNRKISTYQEFGILLKTIPSLPRQKTKEYMVRMDMLASAGIPKEELTAALAGKNRPDIPLNALETKAALLGVGLNAASADQVVTRGLNNDFFTSPAWDLARMVRAARRKGIDPARISNLTMDVVDGKTNIQGACRAMGINPADVQQARTMQSSSQQYGQNAERSGQSSSGSHQGGGSSGGSGSGSGNSNGGNSGSGSGGNGGSGGHSGSGGSGQGKH